jgi:hypothetical protein
MMPGTRLARVFMIIVACIVVVGLLLATLPVGPRG